MTVVNIVAIFVVNICRYINDGQYLFMSAEMSDLVKIRFSMVLVESKCVKRELI